MTTTEDVDEPAVGGGVADDPAEAVARAALVLARLGLVTAFGHVSARRGDQVLITPAADLAEISAADLVTVDLDAEVLPPAAAAETWAHLAVYRRRPDVRAIARAQPPSTFVAGAMATDLRPLYGQAAWLGRRVPVHPGARLLRSRELADAAAATLAEHDAMVLRGNGALTTATSPGLAVTRMWLLDTACQVWSDTRRGGPAQPLSDDDIDAWRAAAPPLLDRLWRHLDQRSGGLT